MKSVLPTAIQKQIISEHQEIEGNENFNFFPASDGIGVYMVNQNTGQMNTITPKPEEPNQEDGDYK